jgi:hypothetical protein
VSSRTRRRIGNALLGGGVLAALIWCGPADGPSDSAYFETNGSTQVGAPAPLDEAVYFGVLLVAAHDGDVVRMERLEPVDPFGGVAVEALSAVLEAGTAWIGAGTERDVRAAGIDPATYQPLVGTDLTAADGWTALAVRLTGRDEPFGFRAVRLVFTVNAGPLVSEAIPFGATVCPVPADSTRSVVCRPP